MSFTAVPGPLAFPDMVIVPIQLFAVILTALRDLFGGKATEAALPSWYDHGES